MGRPSLSSGVCSSSPRTSSIFKLYTKNKSIKRRAAKRQKVKLDDVKDNEEDSSGNEGNTSIEIDPVDQQVSTTDNHLDWKSCGCLFTKC